MKGQMLGVLMLLGGPVAPLMAQQGVATPAGQPAPQAQAAEAGQVAQAKTADAAKKNEKVCKLMTVSGSRFKSRLCYTQHDWDAIDRAHKDKMREIDSQPINQRSEGG